MLQTIRATMMVFTFTVLLSAQAQLVSPSRFTREYSDALKKEGFARSVETLKDLELRVTLKDGATVTNGLYNAYDLYKQTPGDKSAIIKKYIGSLKSTLALPEKIDVRRIVPIIKTLDWLTQMPSVVSESLAGDLVVVYAEDLPKGFRFLHSKDVDLLRIDRAKLRGMAISNLLRIIPDVKSYGENGQFGLAAGGDHEASLILAQSIWSSRQLAVKGERIFGIPAKDLILTTGSGDPAGLDWMQQVIDKTFMNGSHLLSRKMYVWRGGKLMVYQHHAGAR